VGRAVVLALSVAAVAAGTGCTTHQCDPNTVVLGGPEAGVIDGSSLETIAGTDLVVWRSSQDDGTWLDFPGQRTYVLIYSEPFACPPELHSFVAADLNDAQGNFVENGGSLVEYFGNVRNPVTQLYDRIGVFNPSCAEYGLLVTATGIPASSPSPRWCGDAGNDAAPDDAPGD
jgi:hypothetical protein